MQPHGCRESGNGVEIIPRAAERPFAGRFPIERMAGGTRLGLKHRSTGLRRREFEFPAIISCGQKVLQVLEQIDHFLLAELRPVHAALVHRPFHRGRVVPQLLCPQHRIRKSGPIGHRRPCAGRGLQRQRVTRVAFFVGKDLLSANCLASCVEIPQRPEVSKEVVGILLR